MKENILSYDRMKDAASSALFPRLEEAAVAEWDVSRAAEIGIFGFDSRDQRSRPFNLLRGRLLKLMKRNDWKSLGVVSATPGAGKSFVSSNLAAALSHSPDHVVFLIDLDLRRPTIASNFGLPSQGAGVTEFLTGDMGSLQGFARRIGTENLIILPTYPSTQASAELVANNRMSDVLDAARALPAGHVVVCDLPPVFANDDAAIVAEKLDAYLLIVEAGQTTAKQVRDSMNLLAPSVCAGTILNRYHGGVVGDDYGYGYGNIDPHGDDD